MSRREASVELEQTLLVVARGKGILRVESHKFNNSPKLRSGGVFRHSSAVSPHRGADVSRLPVTSHHGPENLVGQQRCNTLLVSG